MEGMYSSENSLKSEIEELKSGLTTVTEAMILFQEFIEQEIGEMSYFRDSGSYYKLVETLNKMRVKTLKVASPQVKSTSMIKSQHRHSLEMESRICYDMEDDEQVEVDVDYNDDDPVDEITIRQVYSVPSPTKECMETSIKKNSAITITPVYSEERKREQQQFAQPSIMLLDKNALTAPQFLSTESHPFMVVEHQRIVPAMGIKVGVTDHERMVGASNNNLGPPPAPNVSLAMTMANLPPPPPVYSTPIPIQSNKSLKNGQMKKSLLRMNNPMNKRKPGRVAKNAVGTTVGPKGEHKSVNGIDQPLNLKKKLKRPSECPVKCNFCGKSYSSKGVMSRHIKEAHKAEPQFPCFYCTSKFRNGPARLEHMNSHHPEDISSVICPYCKRKSSSVAGKRNHMMLCARKHRIILGGLPPSNPNLAKATLGLTPDSGVKMEASPLG